MKNTTGRTARLFGLLALGHALTVAFAAEKKPDAASGPEPETVYCVSSVKPGRESAYAELRAKAWAIYRRLDLVLPKPHLVVRGVDDAGKTYFAEIFTWKDAAIPDHAPREVREIWRRLEETCEPRNGRPGLDFTEGGVEIVESE